MSKILKFCFIAFCPIFIISFFLVEHDQDVPDNSAINNIQSKSKEENWKYFKNKNSLTDKIVYFACIDSKNKIRFDFPYNGASTGCLCFRNVDGLLDGYFTVDKGQILCPIDGCDLRIRFDDGAIQSKHVLTSSTYESNTVYFKDPSDLVRASRNSRRLRIATQFYQSGEVTFEFDPHGFDLDLMLKQ